VKETESLDALDPDTKKAVHTEIVRQSITFDSLSDVSRESTKNIVKEKNRGFDKLSKEQQEKLILNEATKPEKVQEKLAEYEIALEAAKKK